MRKVFEQSVIHYIGVTSLSVFSGIIFDTRVFKMAIYDVY